MTNQIGPDDDLNAFDWSAPSKLHKGLSSLYAKSYYVIDL